MISRVGVGIVGFGTVGSGVAKILLENAALIRRRVGVPIELVRIADLDMTRDRGIALPAGVLVKDAKQILADPAIDIVVELVGGYDFAKRLILDAIAAGKTRGDRQQGLAGAPRGRNFCGRLPERCRHRI